MGGGGFDNYNNTPVNHVLDHWYGYFTPDYFNSFCNSGGFSVPNSYFGFNYAKNGNAYIGFAPYQKGDESKEYVYQQLNSPLEVGKIYCINFFISRASRSTYAIKNIEVLFSNTLINLSNGYIQSNPQIVKQVNFVTDTTIWTQIQGCFTANGGEAYLMIGNFNSNTNTDTLFVGTTNPIPFYGDFSYYYIDDITLIDQSTVGVNELSNRASFYVYPNPANDGLNIEFIDHPELVSGSHEMLNPPAGGQHAYKIKITDVIGRDVLVSEYKSQLDVSFLEKGIYFVSIQQDSKTLGVKKVVKEQ